VEPAEALAAAELQHTLGLLQERLDAAQLAMLEQVAENALLTKQVEDLWLQRSFVLCILLIYNTCVSAARGGGPRGAGGGAGARAGTIGRARAAAGSCDGGRGRRRHGRYRFHCTRQEHKWLAPYYFVGFINQHTLFQ
jgi:hypothetical protein